MSNRRIRRLPLLGFGACLVFSAPGSALSQVQDLPVEVVRYADTIYYNGPILTMDKDKAPFTVARALAVRDGRVLAVGDEIRILKMAGPVTNRVDLAGRAVMPGVVDTHSHPNSYGLSHYASEYNPAYIRFLRQHRVKFITVNWESKETALADFSKATQGLPAGDWIYSRAPQGRVANAMTRYDLDQVTPNNPVYVLLGNAMPGTVNTKMLEIITDLYGGRVPGVIKDEKGIPNGQLLGAMGETVDEEVMPQMPPELQAAIFRKELDEWAAIGVTTLSTRLNGGEITTYAYLDRRGELPLRMAYSHEVGRRNAFLERDLKRFGGIQGHGTDRMWLIGVSVGNPDGDPPGSSGGGRNCTTLPKLQLLPLDAFPEGGCSWDLPDDPGKEAPVIANRYGYRIAGVHNFGDKAIQMSLAAYEKANQEKPILKERFALDHGPMISPENIRQAAKLGAVWSLQPPLFYNITPNIAKVWGEEVAQRWAMPVRSLLEAGVKFSYGADTHRDPDRHPMFGLQVMVTRKNKEGKVYGAGEKLDRATALLSMTRWGAEYVLKEKEIGSLEPGKLADLILLDRNPLDNSVPDDELSQIKVLATVIGGKLQQGSLESR